MANKISGRLRFSKPDTSRISMLITLAKYNLFKPGEAKGDLDTASFYISKARTLSDALHLSKWRHECESIAVIILMEQGQNAAGTTEFNKMIAEFKRTKDEEAEATLRFRFGTWLGTRGDKDQKVLDQYVRASVIFHDLHEPLNENQVLMRVASMHYNEGKIDMADREYRRILKTYQLMKYPRLQYIYNWLATINRVKGNLNDGLKYEMLCIRTMEKNHDTLAAARFYGDFGRMYIEVGNTGKAVEWYSLALKSFIHEGQPQFPMYVAAGYLTKYKIAKGNYREALHFNLSLVKRIPPLTLLQKACAAQNLAICYDALRQPATAEKYYLQAIQLYKQSGETFEVAEQAWQAIGRFYVNHGKYKKAGYYLKATLTVKPQTLSMIGVRDIQSMLFQVDSAKGNYLSAIAWFKKAKILNDSIFNLRKVREIEELQIQYESENKDRSILAQRKNINLLNRMAQLQDGKLKQTLVQQRLLLAGALMLLTIIILGYNRYRIKQANNLVIQFKQQEISEQNEALQRLLIDKTVLFQNQDKLLTEKEHLIAEKNLLLSEVHHRVKNNLQLILSLLESQAAFLEKGEVLQAIKNSQHRINAISLIHQRLYVTDKLTSIRLDEYLQELVGYLVESFDIGQRIVFELLLDKVVIDITRAVPIGIIVNEVVINAIKYAFPNEARGLVKIHLNEGKSGKLTFLIEDNGVGPLGGSNYQTGKSLGFKLIRGLCSELRASLSIEDIQGLRFKIDFQK